MTTPNIPPAGRLIVVGVTGRAGAGKDTVANALTTHLGFRRVALADGVRSAFNDLSGPTGEFFKELTPDHNYRRALQLLGTEARYETWAPHLWIHLLLCKIAYASAFHPIRRSRFVVPDVRYEIEHRLIGEWVRAHGGRYALIRVERPGLAPIAEAHSSETEVDRLGADWTVENAGTLGDLVALAVAVGRKLMNTDQEINES